jgi:hypothetical protein
MEMQFWKGTFQAQTYLEYMPVATVQSLKDRLRIVTLSIPLEIRSRG